MGLPDLYPAQVGSPWTTLAAPYTTGDTTLTVVDATKLPDAPNIVCLAGSVAGEFRYTGKDGNTLTGVTKLSGTPETTWPAGTFAFRGISAYDHASIVEHLTYLRSHIVEATLDLTTNHTYSGRVLDGAEAGENLTFGDLAVLAESGKFVKADPSTLATLDGTIALVVSDTIAAGSQGMFLLRGLIRNDSWTFSPGKELYASNGTLTHEPPTTGTQIICKVGTALTATIIEFNPSSTLHAEYLVSVLPVNTISKDNGDVERKFWKDDFSVDSSSQYTGDVASFTWDTANKRLLAPAHGKKLNCPIPFIPERATMSLSWTGDGASQTAMFFRVGSVMYRVYFLRESGREGSSAAILFNVNTATVITYKGGFNTSTGVKQRLGFEFDGNNIRLVAGNYRGDWIPTTGVINYISIVCEGSVTSYIEDLTYLPSISYSDDFTTDTTERYQPVLGTVAYDDTNKRMTITAEAGVTAKTRLKSYKQLEGAYKRKLHLPATGMNGDVVAAYFGSEATLTSGFGVGAIRTAGAWNIATIDGATVTDTGTVIPDLADGDSFYVEVERDVTHGVVWYYVYKSTKPTTASGKIFNTYQEVYDGFWFKNNGAAEKSIAVSEIEDRAESIVGRTNVEVTEPFWFRDEFREDSRRRYIRKSSEGMTSSHYKIEDGYFKITRPDSSMSGWMYYPTRLRPTRISGIVKRESTTERPSDPLIYFNISGTWHGLGNRAPTYGYGLRISGTSITLLKYDSSNDVGVTIGRYMTTVPYDIDFEFEISITDGTISVKWDSVENVIVVNDSTYTDGYVGLACWSAEAYSDFAAFNHIEISGTRVYNKPIHRGAMLETYHDGTQKVVGTTLIHDFNWDRSAELSSTHRTTIDTVNGYQMMTGTEVWYPAYYFKGLKLGYGVYDIDFICGSGENIRLVFGAQTEYGNNLSGGVRATSYCISFHKSLGKVILYYRDYPNPETQLYESAYTFTEGTKYYARLIWINGYISVYVGTSPTNMTHVFTTLQTQITTPGYFGAVFVNDKQAKICRISAIAASSDATNGIAACIPPIGGGARYGVEESVYIPITPGTEIPVGSAVISPNAKSTVAGTALTAFAQTPAGVSASLEYATGTKTCPGLSTAFAPTGRHRVKADRNTLTYIGVKGSVAGTSPAVYIDSLHVRRQEVA